MGPGVRTSVAAGAEAPVVSAYWPGNRRKQADPGQAGEGGRGGASGTSGVFGRSGGSGPSGASGAPGSSWASQSTTLSMIDGLAAGTGAGVSFPNSSMTQRQRARH